MSTDETTRDAVIWAYRLLLGREPESAAAVAVHVSNSPTLSALREAFFASDEFRSRRSAATRTPLHGDEPPRIVETEGDPQLLSRLFEHVNRTWRHLGEIEPYWSVLTAPEYRGAPSTEHVARFFASGASDVDRMRRALDRDGLALDGKRVCLEYGCGLGRATRHLAPLFARTIGVDISASHLKRARELAERDGVERVDWLALDTLQDLDALPSADFIFSMIVLQHNPPPVIERILSTFARLLNRGGIAYFQVPTYRADYEFRLAEYVRSQVGRTEMEMHAFPQRRVFEIFAEHDALPVSVVEDGATGYRDGERSNTFIFRKRAA